MSRYHFDHGAFFCILGYLFGCMVNSSHYYEKMSRTESYGLLILISLALVVRLCYEKDSGATVRLSEKELRLKYADDFKAHCEELGVPVLEAIRENSKYSRAFNAKFRRRFNLKYEKLDELKNHVITVFEGGRQ